VGDPPVLRKDGWTVANWKYENKRFIALHGYATRQIDKSCDHRLTRSYEWDKDLPDYILPVEFGDAQVIMEICPHEFKDVTDHPNPASVTNTPIILNR